MIEVYAKNDAPKDPILDAVLSNVSDEKKMTMYARIENSKNSTF